jgi:histidine triad (HIT) family protein
MRYTNQIMDTIFTKIIKREIPAEIIYEDDLTIVIPDKFPSTEGQLLVISKRQVPYVYDLTEIEYLGLMQTTKKMALLLDKIFKAVRTCSIIEGFEVPHVHVRLYPCIENKLITEPRIEATSDELKVLADKMRELL